MGTLRVTRPTAANGSDPDADADAGTVGWRPELPNASEIPISVSGAAGTVGTDIGPAELTRRGREDARPLGTSSVFVATRVAATVAPHVMVIRSEPQATVAKLGMNTPHVRQKQAWLRPGDLQKEVAPATRALRSKLWPGTDPMDMG